MQPRVFGEAEVSAFLKLERKNGLVSHFKVEGEEAKELVRIEPIDEPNAVFKSSPITLKITDFLEDTTYEVKMFKGSKITSPETGEVLWQYQTNSKLAKLLRRFKKNLEK